VQVWLGGTPNLTQIARSFMDKVKVHDLEKVCEPLFYHWKLERQTKESFGEYTTRMVSITYNFSLTLSLWLEHLY